MFPPGEADGQIRSTIYFSMWLFGSLLKFSVPRFLYCEDGIHKAKIFLVNSPSGGPAAVLLPAAGQMIPQGEVLSFVYWSSTDHYD